MRVLAQSCTLHIFHSLLSRPAVSDLTKLNRWWFGPIMFRRTQANRICWLLLCLSFFFALFSFYPYRSRRGNGVLWLSNVCLTVYRKEDGEGESTEYSHTNLWVQGLDWTAGFKPRPAQRTLSHPQVLWEEYNLVCCWNQVMNESDPVVVWHQSTSVMYFI